MQRRRALQDRLLFGLHLAVLWSFAIAQPLFDVVTPDFFLGHDAARVDIVVLAIGLLVVPPALLLLAVLAAGRLDERAGDAVGLALVAGLTAIFASQLLRDLFDPPATVQGGLGLLAGLLGALAYRLLRAARITLTVLGPMPVVFLALFLLSSPVARLMKGESTTTADGVAARTPVVVVVFDELPAISLMDARGRIDAVRYPAFAAFARTSTWFRNATSVHSQTEMAVPAVLSGRRSRIATTPSAAEHPENVFTLLGGSYRLNVSEPYTDLCPESLCPESTRRSLMSRMGSLLPDVGLLTLKLFLPAKLGDRLPSPYEVKDLDHGAQVDRFERRIARGGQRLDAIHLLLPHFPWRHLPSGQRYPDRDAVDPGLRGFESWGPERWVALHGYQRHLLQLGYADRLLGRIVERLKRAGAFDRALVIVTADHGVAFTPGSHRRETVRSNAEQILSVPLLVKRPFQRRARTSRALVRTTDVLPTIADVLGIRRPWRLDGRSAFDPAVARRRTVAMTNSAGERVALRADAFEARMERALRHKLAHFGAGEASLYRMGPRPELLGRRVAGSALRPAAGVSVELADRTDFVRVEPGGPLVPGRIAGTLGGPAAAAGRDVALAINGRVRATTRTHELGGEILFSAMVPPAAFRAGRNTVEVLAVDGERPVLRLGRISPA